MAKPAMIIDVLAGPGKGDEDEEFAPPDERDDAARPSADAPEDLIRSIEAQLLELRRAVAELG